MHRTSALSSLRGKPGRRTLAGLCAGILVLAALVVSIASFALADPVGFPDVPASHPYFAAISDLASKGVIGGYENGNFGPSDAVKRQQFAKMVVLAGGYSVSEADVCPFADVVVGGPSTLFPDNYVAVCAANGITAGKTSTTFDPYSNITRFQVVTMVVRMADDLQPGMLVPAPPAWVATSAWGGNPTHGANAARAEYNGLLVGLDIAALDPNANMTRGEVARVLYNLVMKLESTTSTSSTTTTTVAALGYERLGGVCAPDSGPAAATWGPGHIDLFVRGGDNALHQKVYDNGAWGEWQNLGGVLSSDPAAVSWGPGRIDVFARGADTHLYHRAYFGGAWGSWENLGGVLTSAPAVCSTGTGVLEVVVRGPADILFARVYAAGAWTDWIPLAPAPVASAPGLSAWLGGRLDVFATGLDDKLYHSYFEGYWSALEDLGGTCDSGPGVASGMVGRIDVVVRGPLDDLSHTYYEEGSWSAWQPLQGTVKFQGDPEAVAWGSTRLDVFAVGEDLAVWHKYWDGTEWKP